MTDQVPALETGKPSWRYPSTFWFANGAELFERAAFYGSFIALSLYLTREIGFTDIEAGWVAAPFASILYLLPTFLGALADRIGFRRALMIAFLLLTAGYGSLGLAGYFDKGTFLCKSAAVGSLLLVLFGGAIVKPVISGTVAKCSDPASRARAFSIFYGVVNIGSFTGKSVAAPLREYISLQSINYYAATMAFCAFILVTLFYRDVDRQRAAKKPGEALEGLIKAISNVRFIVLILIVAGFWVIQGQLYASLGKYVLRLLGEKAKPEWLANINPAVVVLLVVPITHLVRKWKSENSIGVALMIIPMSALCISLSPVLESSMGREVSIIGNFTLHPLTIMICIGIALQGLAECFLSPKFLEYASKQAPKGEEGFYMGYSHLTTFFAWAAGFVASGYLLNRYCPDPETLSPEAHAQWQQALLGNAAMPAEYANAHYIWYAFAGVGAIAFLALVIFKLVTDSIDKSRARNANVQ